MKTAVVYASMTGNTELMAQAVAEGAKAAGSEVVQYTASDASAEAVLAADILMFGSPAMGDEVLENTMENFFSSVEGRLSGKKIGLFGSYDWGDGRWMRDWTDRVLSAGGTAIDGSGLIVHLTPGEADLENCRKLGKVTD